MAPLLPNKTYNIPTTRHKYAYISYPPSNLSKPTLLFLHGFPSTSHDWRFQIPHFRFLGYGILAPDLLGYGGTDKPTDVNCYVGSEMSKEIIAILDHEGLGPKGQGGSNGVIAIAHDWGTYLLSQLASRYQYRFEKFVFMSVPYTIPGRRTDVDLVNRKTKERLGYEIMGYFLFLASARAGNVLGENWESFFNLTYSEDPWIWKTNFAPIDAMESFVTTTLPSASSSFLAPYITEEDKAHHHSVFGSDYSMPCAWYVRGINSLGVVEEQDSLKKGMIQEKIEKEALMIVTLKDAVCSPERARTGMKAGVEGGLSGGKLAIVEVNSGHWVMLECPEETNRILERFLETGAKGFSNGGSRASL